MIFLFEPLLQEDDHEHGGHHKIQTFGVEGNQGAEEPAQGSAGDPIQLIQCRDPEEKPALVNFRRNSGGAGDGEGLVTQAENQVGLFPAGVLISVQQSDSVEQVPGVDHQGHDEGLDGIERPQQQTGGDELHGAGVNRQADEQGIPEGKTGNLHENPVGHAQKQVACQNGNGVGKGGPKGSQGVAFLRHWEKPPKMRYLIIASCTEKSNIES